MSKRSKEKKRMREEKKLQREQQVETGDIYTSEIFEPEDPAQKFLRRAMLIYGKDPEAKPLDSIGIAILQANGNLTEERHRAGLDREGNDVEIVRHPPATNSRLRDALNQSSNYHQERGA